MSVGEGHVRDKPFEKVTFHVDGVIGSGVLFVLQVPDGMNG